MYYYWNSTWIIFDDDGCSLKHILISSCIWYWWVAVACTSLDRRALII